MKGSRDYFDKFGTPSISRERLKLETSSLARRLTVMGSNEKNESYFKELCGGVM